jgi:hypothetical protein
VDNFLTQIHELLADSERLARLLALEKVRRGAALDQLVFVGVSNIAGIRWCPQKAVLKSRAEEPMFFAVHLHDRLLYAHLLGLFDDLPADDQALLEAGGEVGLPEVEWLLRRVPLRPKPAAWDHLEVTGPDGRPGWLINPTLPPAQRARCEAVAARAGVVVLDLEADPKLRGLVLEESQAERHRTIRWHFEWGRHVVIGEPDGITDSTIYEFKSTRSRYLLSHLLPVALAQADLYGFFIRRPTKRVQLYVVEEGATQTWESPVDRAAAESLLRHFQAVDGGARSRPPRERWKCRRCDVRAACPICPEQP